MTICFNTELSNRIVICEFGSSLEGSRWVKIVENHPLISLKGETFFDKSLTVIIRTVIHKIKHYESIG